MKTKLMLLTGLVLTGALTSCGNDEDTIVITPSEYITVDAGVGSLTRSTATAFEKDDQISIYVWTGNTTEVPTDLVVNNSVNTYDETKWTANPMMLWKDMTTAHYFIGVYPVKAITNFTADNYDTTIDLLVANDLKGRSAEGQNQGIVPLIFNHVMSKLVVGLTFRNQFEGTPTVTSVVTEAQPGASVNYLTATATAAGTSADVALTTTTANTSYEQVIAPQNIRKIKIVIDSKTYTYTSPSDISLVSGKVQTINLIVGRDQIELGSVSINDWVTGTVIDNGEAQVD